MRPPLRTPPVLALAACWGLMACVGIAGCGGTDDTRAPSDTIVLGGGLGGGLDDSIDPLSTTPPDGTGPGGLALPTSPLAVASSCAVRVDGDLRQQVVSPGSTASVRTDHWLSLEQLAQLPPRDASEPGLAPLDGWLTMSCTLPNGDTVTARTVDDTPVERLPVTPATHVVAPGLPDSIDLVDPGGAATWTVLATLDGALFAPLTGGQAIITTFDRNEVIVTVTAILEEVEPLALPRRVTIDGSFRATCGEPYGGCGP